jgi:hypothetical protein
VLFNLSIANTKVTPTDTSAEIKTDSIINSNKSISWFFLLAILIIKRPKAKNERTKRNIEPRTVKDDRRRIRRNIRTRLIGESRFLKY